MRPAPKPQGKATYVAPEPDRAWLLNEQRKLYKRSREDPDYVFRKLWGLVTDPRNLRTALARVARNKGRRTAGVDGVTVGRLMSLGLERFVDELRAELRIGSYRPSPVRRVLIPKHQQPGKFRALGIPTVKDRVAQAAMKNIMEPIFEADFYPTSHGFRPGKTTHGALEHLRKFLRPRDIKLAESRRLPFQWAIEGDIKGCFDNIDHHALMSRVRARIGDAKVSRLVLAFLKSGVLAEDQLFRTNHGTPQGGILSPLLANIALSALDQRYERHVWPRRTPTLLTDPKAIEARAMGARQTDRRGRHPVPFYVPIRYADDFIILVSAPPGPNQWDVAREAAMREKEGLAAFLRRELGLELSESKTLVTPVTETLRFLGHHVRVRLHHPRGILVGLTLIPKDRSQRLRELIKAHFGCHTLQASLEARLRQLNPILRGWGNYYRHAWGAKRVFYSLDHYVWWTVYRWIRKKHPRVPMRYLRTRYAWRRPGGRGLNWRDGTTALFHLRGLKVEAFRQGWLRPPAFAQSSMESPVRIERRTPGSEGGARKPARR